MPVTPRSTYKESLCLLPIEDATPQRDGIMNKLQAAKLAALTPGGGGAIFTTVNQVTSQGALPIDNASLVLLTTDGSKSPNQWSLPDGGAFPLYVRYYLYNILDGQDLPAIIIPDTVGNNFAALALLTPRDYVDMLWWPPFAAWFVLEFEGNATMQPLGSPPGGFVNFQNAGVDPDNLLACLPILTGNLYKSTNTGTLRRGDTHCLFDLDAAGSTYQLLDPGGSRIPLYDRMLSAIVASPGCSAVISPAMGVGGGNFSSITLQTKLDWARVFFNSQVWNVLAVGGTTLVTP